MTTPSAVLAAPEHRQPYDRLRIAAPREPLDAARTGRHRVRRRARGMTTDAAAAALDVARFDVRQDSRFEDLAGDERGPGGARQVGADR